MNFSKNNKPTSKKYRIYSWIFGIFAAAFFIMLVLMPIGFNSFFSGEKEPVPPSKAGEGSYIAMDVVALEEELGSDGSVRFCYTLAEGSEKYNVFRIVLSKEDAESDVVRSLLNSDGNHKPVRIYGTIESHKVENRKPNDLFYWNKYMKGSLEPELTLNDAGSSVLFAAIFSVFMMMIFAALISKEKKKIKAEVRKNKKEIVFSQDSVVNKSLDDVIKTKQPPAETNETFFCYVCERELPVNYCHHNHICFDCAPLNPEFYPLGITPKNIRKSLDLGTLVAKDSDFEKVDAIANNRGRSEAKKANVIESLSKVMSVDILRKKIVIASILTERMKKDAQDRGEVIKVDIAQTEMIFATDYTLACQNPEFLKNKVESASLDDLIDAYLVLKYFCNAIKPELITNIRHFCHFICDRILSFEKVYKGEEPISLDGTSIHFNSKNYFAWKEANPLKQYEFSGAIPLNEKQPVISLIEDGVETRKYVLETENDEDFTGKYFHFMTWINVLGTPAVPVMQLDGFIDDVPENAKFDSTRIGYRMEGHFLRCGGEDAEVRRNMNRGQDLPMKALKYQGIVTPSNVRLVGVCPDCGKSFCFHGYAFYMMQQDIAYSDDGLDCCVINDRNIDNDTWSYETDGKIFRYYNSFNCPHCGTPYIDYKKYPENKVFGASGCVLLNRKHYVVETK